MTYPERPNRRATETSPDLGGMKRFVATFLANLVGTGRYIIGTLPHPRTPEDTQVALQWAANPVNNHVYVDKDHIVYVNFPGVDGWLEPFKVAGISVTDGKNHGKYEKQAYRPTTCGFAFPDDMDLRVHIMEPDEVRAFSQEDLSSYTDEQVEMILDGMFVLSKDIWRMLQQSVEGNKDPFKTDRRRNRVQKTHEMNVRIWTQDGFVKGDAVRAHGKLPGNAMVYTSRANVKPAIRVNDGGKRFIIAEPNGGKDQAFSNIQELAWFHAVPNGITQMFTLELLKASLDDYLEKCYQTVVNGELTERFADVESFMWKHMKDLGIPANTVLNRWAVVEAVSRGFDYRTSPSMLKSVATNHRTNMVDGNGHPRFPLPNAEYRAVKSVSMLRLAGYKVKTPNKGFIEYHPGTDTWFLCDSDWIDHSVDFGGHDGDDHFTVMSVRDSHGEHRMLVWRMPMDSYAMFRTTQKGISHVDSKGTETFAFQMSRNSDLTRMPKPLSRLMAEGRVVFTGLPSQKKPKDTKHVLELTRDQVMEQIKGLSGQNAALGAYVNSLFLYRWVFKTLPSTMPGMLSDVVDSSDPDDVQYVLEYSANLVREVLNSGKPIPRSYWNTSRAYGFNLVLDEYQEQNPGYTPNFVEDDKLGKMTKVLNDAIKDFDRSIDAFAQENHALVDNSIAALFSRDDALIQDAQRLILNFRSRFQGETKRKNQDHQEDVDRWLSNKRKGPRPVLSKSFKTEAWLRLRDGIMNGITLDKGKANERFIPGILSLEGDERDRLVLALYVVAHKSPKKSGEFNDNFIVQSQVDSLGDDVGSFRHLMEALANYGYVAADITIDDDGNLRRKYNPVKTWDLTCVTCKTHYYVSKSEQVKAFQDSGRICRSCR